ncbi:MAG: NAD(+)/NADH kinase [Ignavibacteriales bacterium]|nr:NAD(+)/NADH kinase [Ignavibacteriales bacterium]
MKFGIIANTTKPALQEIIGDLLAYLHSRNLQVVLTKELTEWCEMHFDKTSLSHVLVCNENDFVLRADMIIALGGDGTMLSTARLVGSRGKPILGINLGKLGFLAEVSIEETHQCIDDIVQNNYVLEERMVLEAKSLSDNELFYALNEIVIDKGALPRVIELETHVDNDYMVTYSADGIIMNTPTGSTAYSLASGGPIVHPACNVITINPVAPHTLTARPVIVPDTSEIKVTVKSTGHFAHITADGQVEKFYDTPAEFIVRKADYTIKLVKRKQRTYYDLLRTKLQWGKDIRTQRTSS